MNLAMLKGVDPSALDKDIRAKLTDLAGGKSQQVFQVEKLNADKKAAKLHMEQYTMDVCNFLSGRFNFWPFDVCLSICRCLVQWIWGRKHNFLHNMTDEAVPAALLESETRDYIDVGLLLNSPYFSVLREERDIDLIISLDFSDGEDPFMVTRRAQRSQHALQAQIGRLQQDKRRLQDEMALLLTQREELEKKCLDFRKEQADILPRLEETKWETVRETAETCRKLKIPFPEANITSELSEKPKDFYVFKGQNTPTVIHIPLFNVGNCGDKIEEWTNKYATFQGPYSAEMITELMEVAGKNITNNKEKLLDQIRAITKAKLIQAVNS